MHSAERMTQEQFVMRSNLAIAQGYVGIDLDGNPTHDLTKADTIGPGLRAMLDGEPEQYILNDSQPPARLIACWADAGRPLSLQVIGKGEIRLMTDRGERILHHGFEPAWDVLGFVNVELPHWDGDKAACFFNPQVAASLFQAGLLCGFGFQNPDWTAGRKIELVDEMTAWNIISSKMEADMWAIGTVAAELTWIDDGDKPIPAYARLDMDPLLSSGDYFNTQLVPYENMLWRLIMSLRKNREECAYADAFRHLAERNAVYLAARLSHYRQLAAEYPDLGV